MIRAIVLILGLALGLTGALIWGGQLAHMRLAFGDSLPEWTTELDAETGVMSGHGQVAAADLRWQFVGANSSGPHWHVTLSGPDWQAQSEAQWMGRSVTLHALSGVLPAALLAQDAQGMIALHDGEVQANPLTGQITAAQIEGTARDLQLAGAVFSGPVTLIFSGGVWRVQP